MIKAVLFDLDGTLADSAPDLVATANQQRIRRGLEPLPYERLRNFCSQGTTGLLAQAVNVHHDDPEFEQDKQQFLDDYEALSPTHTVLFDGITELLAELDRRKIVWGIVTNKLEYLTWPVLRHLALTDRSQTSVCGDTTPEAKPSPLPLLHACSEINIDPADCIYIGDDARDILAGKAAGMKTMALTYGYSLDEESAKALEPDMIAHAPKEIMLLLAGLF